MKIEILVNDEAFAESFYRLRIRGNVGILQPQLRLWVDHKSQAFQPDDELKVLGDGQVLFTGPVQRIGVVERSRLLVEAYEPLSREFVLNFHKEKWCNIAKEVWPDCELRCDDFELEHYSLKGSQKEHLQHLLGQLEVYQPQKDYWAYLDESNTLQVHEAGRSRGENPAAQGSLISRGSGADNYQPFPLLLGMAAAEGVAEGLELMIDGAKGRVKVSWSPATELAENLYKHITNSTIENRGSRTIYIILSSGDPNYNPDNYVRALHSGSAYVGKTDGAVDVVGRVVAKKGEYTDLIFNGDNQFEKGSALSEQFLQYLKKQGFGDPLPYGLYYGRDEGGELKFYHETRETLGPAMKKWYDMAVEKANGTRQYY